MKAYIQTSCARPDGTRDTFLTVSVDAKVDELPWQKAGLSFTATGYGRRIPSRYKVFYRGKWRRVYVRRISNAGTAYLGNLQDCVIVSGICG